MNRSKIGGLWRWLLLPIGIWLGLWHLHLDVHSSIGQGYNNVTLTFDDTGIHSSIGPEILWTRDAQGRITQITDPAGNALVYSYKASGDLESFINQIGETTRQHPSPNTWIRCGGKTHRSRRRTG